MGSPLRTIGQVAAFATLAMGLVSSSVSPSARAEDRAIVFAATCPAYESTTDDIAQFGRHAISQLDPLKKSGWNVIPMYGGNSVWCDPSGNGVPCKGPPSRTGRFANMLVGTSFRQSDFKEASRDNFLSALKAAAEGPNALGSSDRLFISVNTHGDGRIFCTADGELSYQDPEARRLLGLLREHGVRLAYDANHCFSGGAVTQWQEYGCVVSASSSVTTGSGYETTLADILSDPGRAARGPITAEDLFISRMQGAASIHGFRQPEISGFGPGNEFDDRMADALFPGDRYDLSNTFLFLKSFNSGRLHIADARAETSLDDATIAMFEQFRKILSSWEPSGGSSGSGAAAELDAFAAKAATLGEARAEDLRVIRDLSPGYYGQVTQDLASFIAKAKELRELSVAERKQAGSIGELRLPPFELPDIGGLAHPGTEAAFDGAWARLKDTLQIENLVQDGRVARPMQLGELLQIPETGEPTARIYGNAFPGSLQALAEEAAGFYVYGAPKVSLSAADHEHLVQELRDRLSRSRQAFLDGLDAGDSSRVRDLLTSYPALRDQTSSLESEVISLGYSLSVRISGRIAQALYLRYQDYKRELRAPGAELTPAQRLDKQRLDSCSSFTLIPGKP